MTETDNPSGLPYTQFINFEYKKEDDDGELCDFSGEINCRLDDELVESCNREIEESSTGMSQHEWDTTTEFVINTYGSHQGYDMDDMEEVRWLGTDEIGK